MAVKVHCVIYDRFDIRVDKNGNLVLDNSIQIELSLSDGRSVFIRVESGATWDGLSVPWMFQWFLKRYDATNALYNISGLVHDVLYAHEGFGIFSRSECDDILRGILRLSGKWRIQASLADVSVGVFGIPSWGEDDFKLKAKSQLKLELDNNEDDMQNRPSLEERVKHYPKIQWLLSKYADKAYPIIDKHDIEAALTEVLDDMDKLKGVTNQIK